MAGIVEWPPIEDIVSLDLYQEEANKTAIFPPAIAAEYLVMGALGEAGEAAKIVLDAIDRAIALDPSFGTSDQLRVRYALKTAVDACAVVEKLKKPVGRGELDLKPLPPLTDAEKTSLGAEVSDCGWYFAGLATWLGKKLSQIAQYNIQKLRRRKKDGVLMRGSGESIEDRKRSM
jgi:hypothetical protein